MLNIMEFIKNQNDVVKTIIVSIIQLIIFIITKNYLLYVLFGIIFLAYKNIHLMKSCITKLKKMFIEKNEETMSLDKSYFDKNICIGMIKKASIFSLDYTDNIIISAAIGHHASLVYSNYNIILSSFSDILENTYEIIFKKVNTIALRLNINSKITRTYVLTAFAVSVYALTAFILFDLFNSFMRIWIGHKYMFRQHIVCILIIDFCLAGIVLAATLNRKIFKVKNYKEINPFIILALNILFSLVLSTKFGIIGIVIGSIFSKAIINICYEIIGFNRERLCINRNL